MQAEPVDPVGTQRGGREHGRSVVEPRCDRIGLERACEGGRGERM